MFRIWLCENHLFRAIYYHRSKGSVPSSRLWSFFCALGSGAHLRPGGCVGKEGSVCCERQPAHYSQIYLAKAEWDYLRELAKVTVSVFEKNDSFRWNFPVSSFLEAWFLPYPSSCRLNQFPSRLWLVGMHMSVFIRVLITSATCRSLPICHEPLLGLSHLGNPRSWRGTRHIH